MATATLSARVAQLEKTVAALSKRLQARQATRDEIMLRVTQSNAAIRKTRKLKTLSMPPLRNLPADLSMNTKDKVRAAIAQRHAANR